MSIESRESGASSESTTASLTEELNRRKFHGAIAVSYFVGTGFLTIAGYAEQLLNRPTDNPPTELFGLLGLSIGLSSILGVMSKRRADFIEKQLQELEQQNHSL